MNILLFDNLGKCDFLETNDLWFHKCKSESHLFEQLTTKYPEWIFISDEDLLNNSQTLCESLLKLLSDYEKENKKRVGVLIFIQEIESEKSLTDPKLAGILNYPATFIHHSTNLSTFSHIQFAQCDRHLKELNRISLENGIYKQDLILAKKVHNKILENPLPDPDFLDICVQYHPHQAIGGDIYSLKQIDDDEFFIFMSDATGHGLKAALIVMIIKSLIEEATKHTFEPKLVMKHVNDNITGMLGTSFCGTAFCARLNLKKRTINYSNAAHPPQILYKNEGNKIVELLADSVCLGIFPDETFEQNSLDFCPGDRLILFTDGLYEFTTKENEIFGLPRFYQLISEFSHNFNMKELSEGILKKIKDLHDDPSRGDDINLIAVKFPDKK